jgi:hypothetical protein
MRAGTGARGMLQSKRGPEEERNKLASIRRKMQEMIRGEEIYPEAISLCFFGMGTPIFCLFILSADSG